MALNYLQSQLGLPSTPAQPMMGSPLISSAQPQTGQDPTAQMQQGMAQLQGLTQLINQKHQELQGHLQQHARLKQQLGI